MHYTSAYVTAGRRNQSSMRAAGGDTQVSKTKQPVNCVAVQTFSGCMAITGQSRLLMTKNAGTAKNMTAPKPFWGNTVVRVTFKSFFALRARCVRLA